RSATRRRKRACAASAMPTSGRYPRAAYGPRSVSRAAQAAPEARSEALEEGAELGRAALLLAPAAAREGDLRATGDGVRLQLRAPRRRLRLERDQRRAAELLRPEQRHFDRLADQRQAEGRRAETARRQPPPTPRRPLPTQHTRGARHS